MKELGGTCSCVVSKTAVRKTPDDGAEDRQRRWSDAVGNSDTATTSSASASSALSRQVRSVRPCLVAAVRSLLVLGVVARHLCNAAATAAQLVKTVVLGGGYNYDSTAIRLHFDCATTLFIYLL